MHLKERAGLKVGILGAGSVGSALGANLLKAGHIVRYGVRDVTSEKTQAVLTAQPEAQALSVDAVVAWAEAVILAVPGAHAEADIQAMADMLGPNADGKLIIDATNPLSPFPALAVRWGVDGGRSFAEALQERLPGAFVAKAFNTVGREHMTAPDGSLAGWSGPGPLSMLCCGPPEQRELLEEVVIGVGFAAKYVGPLRYARNLEAIAELWIHLAVPPAGETKENLGRNFHFQVVAAP